MTDSADARAAGGPAPTTADVVAAVGSGAYLHEVAGELGCDRDVVRGALDAAVTSGALVVELTHGGHVRRFAPNDDS